MEELEIAFHNGTSNGKKKDMLAFSSIVKLSCVILIATTDLQTLKLGQYVFGHIGKFS